MTHIETEVEDVIVNPIKESIKCITKFKEPADRAKRAKSAAPHFFLGTKPLASPSVENRESAVTERKPHSRKKEFASLKSTVISKITTPPPSHLFTKKAIGTKKLSLQPKNEEAQAKNTKLKKKISSCAYLNLV